MYDWLRESLQDGAVIVTANRRLARILSTAYGEQQRAQGRSAWQSPEIYAWADWLKLSLDSVQQQAELPTRINTQQSQWLWERCLRKELPDKSAGYGNLVRLSRDAWQRLSDWQVSQQELLRSCQTADQRLFAAAAGRYRGVLQQKHWTDDAGLAPLVLRRIVEQNTVIVGGIWLAGFDRVRPVVSAIVRALESNGTTIQWIEPDTPTNKGSLEVFSVQEKEYRAAGAWARQRIESRPDDIAAIVTTGLETNGAKIERWVREGATPGWQNGSSVLHDAVNVSYGRTLSSCPPIAIALLCLRWSIEDVSSSDVSLLLRSNCIVAVDLSARARLETHLRQLPDRLWSPAMLGGLFKQDTESKGGEAWFTVLAELSKRRRERPRSAAPSQWAKFFDETLGIWRWLDHGSLNSVEFQLVNKWRDVLNEFARLSLVSTRMSAATAFAQLQSLSGDTIFQAESKNPRIHLLGPLEAAGIEFDQLWVCGLTASNWPPATRASPLIARRLQEKHQMPDATPSDTTAYARRILTRLAAAAPTVQYSFSQSEDDSDQTMTELVAPLVENSDPQKTSLHSDPGWYASDLRDIADTVVATDKVPALAANEKLLGGAATLQRQIDEPVRAFIHGRLGARVLYPQAVGLPPPLRGNLIHDALYGLYSDLPDSHSLRSWSDEDRETRIADALDLAFGRHERHAGAVLRGLLALERQRVTHLVQKFLVVDAERSDFKVAGVEGKLEFDFNSLHLPLRFDRIDIADDQTLVIIDYKTGAPKQLLARDEQINDIQLFVYALATQKPVSALALANIDSREIAFSGAGQHFRGEQRWDEILADAQRMIEIACEELIGGDIRINLMQGAQHARSLNLLTRYTELQRDAR